MKASLLHPWTRSSALPSVYVCRRWCRQCPFARVSVCVCVCDCMTLVSPSLVSRLRLSSLSLFLVLPSQQPSSSSRTFYARDSIRFASTRDSAHPPSPPFSSLPFSAFPFTSCSLLHVHACLASSLLPLVLLLLPLLSPAINQADASH